MIHTDPLAPFAGYVDTNDLADLAGRAGPFASVFIPSPSGIADAAQRFATQWKNCRAELASQELAPARLAALDDVIGELQHGGAEAFGVIAAAEGDIHVEPMLTGIHRAGVFVGDAPRLVPILESRQRTMPHLIVVTDRVGADIVGFDGGQVRADSVDGDTEHIHRGRFGGWSHRRFQQRAENTWERNARSVAEAVRQLAREMRPTLIAIAGDVRACTFLSEDLADDQLADRMAVLDAGDADGISDEVLRLLADQHARLQQVVLERFRSAASRGDGVVGAEVLDALAGGRVATLLVQGDDSGAPTPDTDIVDRAVVAALGSGAGIAVVPRPADVDAPVAAILRW